MTEQRDTGRSDGLDSDKTESNESALVETGRMSAGSASDVGRIERELEDLADRISALIEGGPEEEREALHDYAVSLVRERLPVIRPGFSTQYRDEPEEALQATSSSQANGAANIVGYGALLFLVGCLLIFLFFPVGIFLIVVSIGFMFSGFMAAIVTKLRSKPPVVR